MAKVKKNSLFSGFWGFPISDYLIGMEAYSQMAYYPQYYGTQYYGLFCEVLLMLNFFTHFLDALSLGYPASSYAAAGSPGISPVVPDLGAGAGNSILGLPPATSSTLYVFSDFLFSGFLICCFYTPLDRIKIEFLIIKYESSLTSINIFITFQQKRPSSIQKENVIFLVLLLLGSCLTVLGFLREKKELAAHHSPIVESQKLPILKQNPIITRLRFQRLEKGSE
jgi:hypothetical protein